MQELQHVGHHASLREVEGVTRLWVRAEPPLTVRRSVCAAYRLRSYSPAGELLHRKGVVGGGRSLDSLFIPDTFAELGLFR